MRETTKVFDSPVTGEDILLIPEVAARMLDMLDDSTWARDLTQEDVQALCKYLVLHEFPKGRVVFREGDEDDFYLAVILKGAVEIVKSVEKNGLESRFLVKMGPGRAFGEMALIDGSPRSASAAVVEDAWLLTLSRDALTALCANELELGVKIIRNIARLLSFRLRNASLRLLGSI